MQSLASWKTRTLLMVSPAWLMVPLIVLPLMAADTGFPMQPRKLTPLETELHPLGVGLYANIVRGDHQLSFCTNDIRAIDNVLERYQGQYSEAVAEVRYNLAIEHWTFFNEPTLAVQRLQALQRDLPESAFAAKATHEIDSIPKAAVGRALRKTLKPGMEFPDFDEKDMNGEPLSIKRFRGKPVVIVTWSTETAPDYRVQCGRDRGVGSKLPEDEQRTMATIFWRQRP
jgi:hypothetical protein